MRAELIEIQETGSGYTTVKARVFDNSVTYLLEVYQDRSSNGIAAKLFGEENNITGEIYGRPKIRDDCLHVSSEKPCLPKTEEEVKAIVLYLRQLCEEDLVYNGTKQLDSFETA